MTFPRDLHGSLSHQAFVEMNTVEIGHDEGLPENCWRSFLLPEGCRQLSVEIREGCQIVHVGSFEDTDEDFRRSKTAIELDRRSLTRIYVVLVLVRLVDVT